MSYWKRDYLVLDEAINKFLRERLPLPNNRVQSMLRDKLESVKILLVMEVNGYDGGMERELLEQVNELDQTALEHLTAFPETPED